MIHDSIHPSPPKEKREQYIPRIWKNSGKWWPTMEKDNIAQDLERGHWWWSSQWWEGRKGDDWRQGSHGNCAETLQGGQDWNLGSSLPLREVWLWAGFLTSCFLGHHTYKTGIIGGTIQCCLCDWHLLLPLCSRWKHEWDNIYTDN